MRKIFTTDELYAAGMTRDKLRWGLRTAKWTRIAHGAYIEGAASPTELEGKLARLKASKGAARGSLAGILHNLDGVRLCADVGIRPIDGTELLVAGYLCANGLTTLLDLAAGVDDLVWEQAFESALRKNLATIDAIQDALKQQRYGNKRIRRVLKLRPTGAPPTESLLETLAVQLMRRAPQLPAPTRQFEVLNKEGRFEARVDLAFPNEGVFFELDGQHHKHQPVYDANRQTRVTAATGWLVGRFTWEEIVLRPKSTLRRIINLFDMCEMQRQKNRS